MCGCDRGKGIRIEEVDEGWERKVGKIDVDGERGGSKWEVREGVG